MARGRLNNVQLGVTAVAASSGNAGQGAFTLAASAINADFDTPAQAGGVSGVTYGWLATDTANRHQLFLGTLTNSSGTWTLSRDTTFNSSAGYGANETFSTAAVISSVELAADLQRAGQADIWAGSDADLIATPKSLRDAQAFVALAATAGTLAWDVNAGFKRSVVATAAITVGAPTNLVDGDMLSLEINPGTFATSFNAIWDFGAAGTPTLPASVTSTLYGEYRASATKLRASVRKGA